MASEHEKDLERISQFCLMDDDFLRVCFDGSIEAVELVVRIVLGREDIFIEEVQIQKPYDNLLGHSIAIDVYGRDAENRRIGVEIQRNDGGAVPERAGYHSSVLDANNLPKGKDYPEKFESYSIWFTEHDVLGGDKPLYHIERYIIEEQRKFGDGAHIIYVNGAYKGDPKSKLGMLVHDFFCTDPDDMHYKALADRVRHFKTHKEGVSRVCRMLEEMRREAAEKAAREAAKETEEKANLFFMKKAMDTLGYSADEAMQWADVPSAERDFYRAKLT